MSAPSTMIRVAALHPYFPELPVEVPIEVLPSLPGGARHWHRFRAGTVESCPADDGALYDAVAGPYQIEGESLEARFDRQMLVSLVWDLAGHPLLPRGPARPPAKWCAVRAADGQIEIWRSTAETRWCHNDQAERRAGAAYRVEGLSE